MGCDQRILTKQLSICTARLPVSPEPTASGFWPATSAPGAVLAAKYLVQNSILAWLSFTSSPLLAFLGTVLKRQQMFQKQSEASISPLREV